MSKGIFVRPDRYPVRREYKNEEEYQKARKRYSDEYIKYMREKEAFDKELEEKKKAGKK